MSDIRYNSWLHRSGTGGVYQDSSGRIGIGTSVPGGAGLHIKEGYSGLSAPGAHQDTLYLENSGNAGVTIATPNTNTGYLTFADPEDDNIGQIIYRHNGNSMGFFVNAAERLRIDTDGRVMIGNDDAASMFSVANNLVVGSGSGSEGMTIYSDSTNDGYIVFADGQSDPAYRMGQIIYSHQSNKLQFRTNGNTDRLTIDNAGNTNISGVCTATTFAPSEGQLANRNVVINGAMEISQRVTSEASVSGSPAFTYNVVDRWVYGRNTSAVVTLSQAADAPTGFKYCYQLDVTTADASPSYCRFVHRIEGNEIRRFGFGVAGTRYATLSFWHKHTKTGTNHVCIQNYANDRSYVAAYTQSTTDTWEKAVITFPIDTSGTWVTTNAGGLLLQWPMCDDANASSLDTWISGNAVAVNSSQVNNLDSTSNYFRLTGVQLELGSTSTPYEHRDYGDELARCQRYFFNIKGDQYDAAGILGYALDSEEIRVKVEFPVPMRQMPTYTGNAKDCKFKANNTSSNMHWSNLSILNSQTTPNPKSTMMKFDKGSSLSVTAGECGDMEFHEDGGELQFSAEL